MQRHIPHSLVCGDPPSVSWFEQPTERYDSRDRSLWLFAAHVSSTKACLMVSTHPSLCSLTSALICAVLHTFLESPPAGCTREYHCLSLQAVLSVLLVCGDSTTVSSALAFNTTSGRDLLCPISLSLALLRGRPHACNRILPYGLLLKCCETSLSRFRYTDFCRMLRGFAAPLDAVFTCSRHV